MSFPKFEFMTYYCPICQTYIPYEEVPNNGWVQCIGNHRFPVGHTHMVYAEYGIIKDSMISHKIGENNGRARIDDGQGSSSATRPN